MPSNECKIMIELYAYGLGLRTGVTDWGYGLGLRTGVTDWGVNASRSVL